MRSILVMILVLTPAVTLAIDPPARKPGLWEIKMEHKGARGGQIVKQCIDAETDAKMLQMSGAMGENIGMVCSKKDIRKEGAKYIAESDCAMGGTRTVTKTIISGDFNSTYNADTTVTHEPPRMGNAVTKMVQTAKWAGPCAAGQKPGDIIMPNGMKINMAEMEELSKKPLKMPFPVKR